MAKETQDAKIDVDFESHPPIDDDLTGITALLKQTLLQFVDCHALAQYLIKKKDLTQVIAQSVEGEEESSSEDDEPDDDIYGVTSIIELPLSNDDDDDFAYSSRKQLFKFICDKCPKFETIRDGDQGAGKKFKVGMLVNERYINLPPQLSLPTLKTLTESIDKLNYTHLIFICKILLRPKKVDSGQPSKKKKPFHPFEPIIFVNPEEEVICENSACYTDIDVSAFCDDNLPEYTPHRRILVVSYKNWPSILQQLESELTSQPGKD